MRDQFFFERLGQVARLCNFELDDSLALFYRRHLEDLDDVAVLSALEAIMLELGGGQRQFPSVAAIRRRASGQVAAGPEARMIDDGEARAATALVIGAVSRFGSINGSGQSAADKTERIKAHVGELAWRCVVMRGGWNFLCETLTNADLPTFEAQFRELAKATLERRRRGVDEAPPALPPAQPRLGDSRPLLACDMANALPADLREKIQTLDVVPAATFNKSPERG